jgi:hypothetical protein
MVIEYLKGCFRDRQEVEGGDDCRLVVISIPLPSYYYDRSQTKKVGVTRIHVEMGDRDIDGLPGDGCHASTGDSASGLLAALLVPDHRLLGGSFLGDGEIDCVAGKMVLDSALHLKAAWRDRAQV